MSYFARLSSVVPARIGLACAFPPMSGFRGAETSVADLSKHGLVHPLFTPDKRSAVALIVERNMESNVAIGNGNKAARRQNLNQL